MPKRVFTSAITSNIILNMCIIIAGQRQTKPGHQKMACSWCDLRCSSTIWKFLSQVNFGDVKIPKNLDYPRPQKINQLNGVHLVSSDPIVVVDAQTLLIPNFSYDGEAPGKGLHCTVRCMFRVGLERKQLATCSGCEFPTGMHRIFPYVPCNVHLEVFHPACTAK